MPEEAMTPQSKWTLAFLDATIEQAFLKSLNQTAGKRFAIVILFVLLFYVPFSLLTIFAMTETPPEVFRIRALIVLVAVILGLLSFTEVFRTHYQAFVAIGCVATETITASLIFRVESDVSMLWQTASAVVLVFVVNAVFRLRFVYSSLIGVSFAFAYIYLFRQAHQSEAARILFSGWLLFSAFYAATISYEIERYARLAFINAHRLGIEQQKSESLLLNILPSRIASRLKEGSETIADGFQSVAVVFADIVDFTPLSQGLSPLEVVDLLNQVFTAFDHLARKYGVEKIKTIGDAYMAAAGIPEPRGDAYLAIAECALAMRNEVFSDPLGRRLELRIGIHAGPAVAGVIGVHKFAYDLWGDTVNTASRMESHGEAGRIQATQAIYERLRDSYEFEYRGEIDIKGKGKLPTWWLIGPRLQAA